MKTGCRFFLGATLAIIGTQSGSWAQSASVREILRVVKTVPSGSTALSTAHINGPLNTGDRVRTGGRSAAGVRFSGDQSLLRIGELSEILITGAKSRETQMVRGRVLADYKSPTTLRSGNAIAAIRGTKVEMRYDETHQRTQVNCYHGRVFVSNAKNGIRAGTAKTLTPTTFVDPDLQGNTGKWNGGELRFIDGPYRGEVRKIAGFDPATGTVTFDPALPTTKADTGANGYLLVEIPGSKVVELLDNQGTDVKGDGDPSNPFRIPHKEFAGMDEHPYWEVLEDGVAFYTYPGTPDHDHDRSDDWPARDAIEQFTKKPPQELDCGCDGPPEVVTGAPLKNRLAHAFAHTIADREARMAAKAPDDPPSTEERLQPGYVMEPYELSGSRNAQFRFEPFALGSNRHDAEGVRVRFQGSTGSVYAELGYRFLHLNGVDQNDISEGYVYVKGKYGNIRAGRQHLFLGPSNNTELGRLLGLESSDAIVYEAPMPRGFKQQFGYVFDTKALQSGGFNAWYARGLARVYGGNLGYSLMAQANGGNNIGYQIDGSQPLIKNVLDIYGEAGVNTKEQFVATGGFYIPYLYHKFKVDVFTEYNKREDVEERLSLRLRREFGNGLLLEGFVNDRLGDQVIEVGGGLMWSKKFR